MRAMVIDVETDGGTLMYDTFRAPRRTADAELIARGKKLPRGGGGGGAAREDDSTDLFPPPLLSSPFV